MEEQWKEIGGFGGRYSVSNVGRVWTHIFCDWRKGKVPGRYLKVGENSNGYCYVNLYDQNGKPRKKSVHRLVAEAFIENPENKKEVNHIDGDRTNSRVDNLEWVTTKENREHSFQSLGQLGSWTGFVDGTHHHSKPVFLEHLITGEQFIALSGGILTTYKLSSSAISEVFNGKKDHHKMFSMRECLEEDWDETILLSRFDAVDNEINRRFKYLVEEYDSCYSFGNKQRNFQS